MMRRSQLSFYPDGTLDMDAWIQTLNIPECSHPMIKEACQLAYVTGQDQQTRFGSTCFEQGLELAEIIAKLKLDAEAIAAAILFSTLKHTDLKLDDINVSIGRNVAKLLQGLLQMSAINLTRQQLEKQSSQQLDNVRKMILAMASDIRVVVIKLAERLCLMRELKHLSEELKQHLAKETLEIFAPLANRLGLQQLKWELEDLSFFTLNADHYKTIAKQLDERREVREERVSDIVSTLEALLSQSQIEAKVYGRAKHIYSIKLKMERKNISFNEVYDAIALRVLLNNIKDCYSALSLVHKQWEPISEEFDDYIATPKPNGYQSIHTAVIDPNNNKKFEIQIRTHQMHDAAELGVAAHWKYKEGTQQYDYEAKIAWLRQILDWQKEVLPLHEEQVSDRFEQDLFKDRIYVFTPDNDIIDMTAGATPLDFAYHIHTQVGHHCQGAKVNGKMVPLTYELQMGDRVEILTSKRVTPSRDWLSPHHGYLKTPHARAKVMQWFRQLHFEEQVEQGKLLLEKELKRSNLQDVSLSAIADQLHYKTVEAMLGALSSGTLKLPQVTALLVPDKTAETEKITVAVPPQSTKKSKAISIQGLDNLLTKTAKCCKPIPGDPIIGYITQTQGITIHHPSCKNIAFARKEQPHRIIEASWNYLEQQHYPTDIEISAYDKPDLGREITLLLLNDHIQFTDFNTIHHRKTNLYQVIVTVQVSSMDALNHLMAKLARLPGIFSAKRIV